MAVQSRSFGLPNPASPTRKRDGSAQFGIATGALGLPLPPPRFAFIGDQPRSKSSYVYDASFYKEVNRLTNERPEVIHRWVDTPPPPKRPYTVAISLVRGQAGAAGVIPPDTAQRFYPFPAVLLKRNDYYPPGSDFYPIPSPLRLEYDPFGGGAFFTTVPRSRSDRYVDFSGMRTPIILLPEQDLPLRHWVDIPIRSRYFDWPKADLSGTKLRQLLDPTSVGEGTSKFWTAAPRYRPAGPTYMVDGGKIINVPTSLIPNGSGGYDIYHYYVG